MTAAAMEREPAAAEAVDLGRDFVESGVAEVLDALDRSLIGLAPVKQRIRETAALLLVCLLYTSPSPRDS